MILFEVYWLNTYFYFHVLYGLEKNVHFSFVEFRKVCYRSDLLIVLFKSSTSSQFLCLLGPSVYKRCYWNPIITKALSTSYIPESFCLFKLQTPLLSTSLRVPDCWASWVYCSLSSGRLRTRRGPIKGIFPCPGYGQIQKQKKIKSKAVGSQNNSFVIPKDQEKAHRLTWRWHEPSN